MVNGQHSRHRGDAVKDAQASCQRLPEPVPIVAEPPRRQPAEAVYAFLDRAADDHLLDTGGCLLNDVPSKMRCRLAMAGIGFIEDLSNMLDRAQIDCPLVITFPVPVTEKCREPRRARARGRINDKGRVGQAERAEKIRLIPLGMVFAVLARPLRSENCTQYR